MKSAEDRVLKVVQKIAEVRKLKQFTIEQMAELMNISTPAYSKIERGVTKLTLERVFQIAQILDTSVYDLLDLKGENIYHQILNDNSVGHQEIKNMYQENRDLTDKLVESYKNEIEFLREMLKTEFDKREQKK